MQAQEFVGQMLQSPVETFHGRGDSALNNELLKAESLLEIGEYYEAVRRYEVAQRLDPLNPLPLIGKGNAFLAAGEYSSATGALIRGFERYPELVEFNFDLTALMGGREIVDIRRADIMRRLAGRDDARLRFLLGYLEYYAGNRESGMANLERAAELDQGSSIISRFPAILRRESALPPPKLLDALPPVPEQSPGGPPPLPRSRIDEGRPNAVGPPTEPEEP
jgi:tetratricopeptide (TPR) repeat protein